MYYYHEYFEYLFLNICNGKLFKNLSHERL